MQPWPTWSHTHFYRQIVWSLFPEQYSKYWGQGPRATSISLAWVDSWHTAYISLQWSRVVENRKLRHGVSTKFIRIIQWAELSTTLWQFEMQSDNGCVKQLYVFPSYEFRIRSYDLNCIHYFLSSLFQYHVLDIWLYTYGLHPIDGFVQGFTAVGQIFLVWRQLSQDKILHLLWPWKAVELGLATNSRIVLWCGPWYIPDVDRYIARAKILPTLLHSNSIEPTQTLIEAVTSHQLWPEASTLSARLPGSSRSPGSKRCCDIEQTLWNSCMIEMAAQFNMFYRNVVCMNHPVPHVHRNQKKCLP